MMLPQYPGHGIAAALVALIVAAYAVAFYTRAWRRLPAWRWVLPVLQIIPALLILAILWDPSSPRTRTKEVPNTILAIFDTSASMSVIDAEDTARLNRAAQVFEEAFPPASHDAPQVAFFTFDGDVRETPGLSGMSPSGTQTQLWGVLRLLERHAAAPPAASRPPAAGAIVFTDGQAFDRPRDIARIARDDFPIAIVGVGNVEPGADVIVSGIEAPERARIDSTFPVRVTLSGRLPDPAPVFVELRIDDVPIAIQEVAAQHLEKSTHVDFAAPAGPLGTHVLEVRASTAATETVMANNVRKTVVNTIDEPRLRVLFYSQWASPDMGKLRQAVDREKKVTLDFVLDAVIGDMRAGRQFSLASDTACKFPEKAEELFAYDVIVLGPCDPKRLSNSQRENLYKFVVDRGGGLLILPGQDACDLAASTDQQIRALLPAIVGPGPHALSRDDASITVTPEGRRLFPFAEDALRAIPDGVTPHYGIESKPAAVVAATLVDAPAVVTHRVGRGNVGMLNLRHLFLLYREDQEGGDLRELMSGLITHLGATVHDEANVEVFAERDPAQHDAVIVTAQVRDAAFQPASGATVLLTVNDDVRYMSESAPGQYHATVRTADDTLLAAVEAVRDGLFLGRVVTSARLPAPWMEMNDVTLDRDYLNSLSTQLGATYLDAADAAPALARMFPATSEVEQVTATTSAWRTWACLALLCGCLTAGWFARRMMGLV